MIRKSQLPNTTPAQGVYDSFLTVDNWGDHASTATNYQTYTSDSKEPVAVVDMDPGTYGVRVEDAAGGTGNANVEFYGLSDDTGNGRFYGLALRAEVGANPVAGGITISGSASKKVMIRVKGSTMSFGGTKLNDPKITITKYNSTSNAYESFLTVDNWGDHASTATNYASRATSDTKEPVAVVDMDPGTYGVRVEDAAGGTGMPMSSFTKSNSSRPGLLPLSDCKCWIFHLHSRLQWSSLSRGCIGFGSKPNLLGIRGLGFRRRFIGWIFVFSRRFPKKLSFSYKSFSKQGTGYFQKL